MGIEKGIFIEAVPLDLLCSICSDVLYEPVQVHCGEDHIFCHQCILQFLKSQPSNDVSCPTCHMPMNTNALQPSKFVQRQLGRLAIRCQYQTMGCTWVGLLSSDHTNQCIYQAKPCKNTERGCTQTLDTTTRDQHELECEYAVMECPNGFCPSSFLRKDVSQHESTCPSYPCLYASNGCQFIGTMPDVNAHCTIYCGRLHDRIQQLEQECLLLSQQLELKKILQQSAYNQHETLSSSTATTPTDIAQNPPSHNDTLEFVDDPLLQVANDNNIFKVMEPISKSNNSANILTSPSTATSPSKIHSTSTVSPGPPKRTSKGKRIRYSKNTKLAHGALRASKSTTTPTTPTGDEDASLYYSALSPKGSVASTPGTTTGLIDEATSPASVGTPNSEDLTRLMDTLSTNSHHAHSPLSFNSFNDVAKFFDTLPSASSPQHQSQHEPMTPTAMKKKIQSSPSPASPSPSPSSPNIHSPLSPSNGTFDAANQKPNPMFVLASSYLSNYK